MADRPEQPAVQGQELFLRADEVDAGTSIASPSRQLPLSALRPPESAAATARPKAPPRPSLRRDGTGPPPPPPSQPPPAPPVAQPSDPTDSLSLPQLRQLVSQFPKPDARAYAYQYKDVEDFETEIDEWFQYTEPEQEREYLLASREAFEQKWKGYCESELGSDDASWMEVEPEVRLRFLRGSRSAIESSEVEDRLEALRCIYYVLCGTWSVTSGLDPSKHLKDHQQDDSSDGQAYNAIQVEWMHRGADIVAESGIITRLYGCLLTAAKPAPPMNAADESPESTDAAFDEAEYRELSLCFSCFYLLLESARVRAETEMGRKIRAHLCKLRPSFMLFISTAVSRLRWDESYNIPLIHAIQLLWKSVMVFFGDAPNNLESVKHILQPRVDPFSAEASHPTLTASPLDYHLFRQEITSKYPSYNPPLPLVPLELEQKTMLPVMPQSSSRPDAPASMPLPQPVAGTSIMHQPVHIATPAPSPPPSPVGPGGKTGKKQNYQTNQNFPFLYPPLDSTSNDLGGKGSTEVQDLMVGKKWEGSDVPTSIIEAGELFASRMRMTRGMKQLWKQRDMFLKYERGWKGDSKSFTKNQQAPTSNSDDQDDDDLEDLADQDLRSRMDSVDDYFHHALPDLQSLVIVLMKVMLANVQDIAIRNGNLQETSHPTGLNRTKSNSNVTQQQLPMPPPPPKPSELNIEDLDNIRSREISQKAVSGLIFLLLKWLKISHILKFEYLTQLLLDSNYVQLTLKYFAHQNLEELIAFPYTQPNLSFFHYCHLHSDHPPLSPTSPPSSPESSISDAIPPPIQRHRRSSATSSPQHQNNDLSALPPSDYATHPTVDELGNPQYPLPTTPLTTYSSRQFFTSITLLRILQKITRQKSHRILLLVQFKSSQILRRILRVPDPLLRLYVLKLFKSQVPYCGRKWRQSNMRVITAIYLHCRPELRDEWLAGMHDVGVEGEVEESVPLEWALRGLTFWWQKRRYADVMRVTEREGEEEGGQEIEEEERDFFQRELDAMGWGMAALGTGEEVAFGEEAAGLTSGGMNGLGSGEVNGGGLGEGSWQHANAQTLESWQNS